MATTNFRRKDLLALVLLAVVAITLVAIPFLRKANKKAHIIRCVGHLKNVGLAFRIFATDHSDRFPWNTYTNDLGVVVVGATNDLLTHFTIVSNEISTPVIYHCPADKKSTRTKDWAAFGRSNISYFLGLNSAELFPQSLLAGDSNLLLDDNPLQSGVTTVPLDAKMRFDGTRHVGSGCVAMGDGSVQQLNNSRLREAARNSGLPEIVIGIP